MRLFDEITWSALGAIGRSPISKVAIIMPFIGYILLLQDDVSRFMSPFVVNGDKLDFELGIGFYFLYFGLFLFGFGSFLFQVASPETAKRFSSADEYVERIHSVTNTSDLTPRLVFILQHVEVGSVVEKEASLYKNALSTGVGSSSQQAAKIFTLRNFFEIEDKSRGVFRIAVFFLFSSGILLTMVPSFIALVRVGRDFSRNYL